MNHFFHIKKKKVVEKLYRYKFARRIESRMIIKHEIEKIFHAFFFYHSLKISRKLLIKKKKKIEIFYARRISN